MVDAFFIFLWGLLEETRVSIVRLFLGRSVRSPNRTAWLPEKQAALPCWMPGA